MRDGFKVFDISRICATSCASGRMPSRLPSLSALATACCMASMLDSPSQPGPKTICVNGTPLAPSACSTLPVAPKLKRAALESRGRP